MDESRNSEQPESRAQQEGDDDEEEDMLRAQITTVPQRRGVHETEKGSPSSDAAQRCERVSESELNQLTQPTFGVVLGDGAQ